MSSHYNTVYFMSKDAEELGVNEAILVNYFRQYLLHLKGESLFSKNGKTFCPASVTHLRSRYSFLSEKQIKYAIQSLREQNVLISIKMESDKIANRNWYCFQDEDKYLGTLSTNSVSNIVDNNQQPTTNQPVNNAIEIDQYDQKLGNNNEDSVGQNCPTRRTKMADARKDTNYIYKSNIKKTNQKREATSITEAPIIHEVLIDFFPKEIQEILVSDFELNASQIACLKRAYDPAYVLKKAMDIKLSKHFISNSINNKSAYLFSTLRRSPPIKKEIKEPTSYSSNEELRTYYQMEKSSHKEDLGLKTRAWNVFLSLDENIRRKFEEEFISDNKLNNVFNSGIFPRNVYKGPTKTIFCSFLIKCEEFINLFKNIDLPCAEQL